MEIYLIIRVLSRKRYHLQSLRTTNKINKWTRKLSAHPTSWEFSNEYYWTPPLPEYISSFLRTWLVQTIDQEPFERMYQINNKPVTLILRWKPKNATGRRGVRARWTSVSMDIRSILFSGECNTQVCSESKSHDRIVQS